MAGTTTVSMEKLNHPTVGDAGKKITVTWTSDASGDVNGTSILMQGLIFAVVTIPSGSAAPTDNYDITLISPDGSALDVLQSLGANRDAAATEQIAFSGPAALTNGPPIYVNGNCEFKVAAAGNAKAGTTVFYVVA